MLQSKVWGFVVGFPAYIFNVNAQKLNVIHYTTRRGTVLAPVVGQCQSSAELRYLILKDWKPR